MTKATLYVGNTAHDVLAGETRNGRVMIALPEGATEPIAIPSAQNTRYLRPGKPIRVAANMVEVR